MTDLHQQIMNIPCPPAPAPGGIVVRAWTFEAVMDAAYRLGHRDARHAAAELVAAHGVTGTQTKENSDAP